MKHVTKYTSNEQLTLCAKLTNSDSELLITCLILHHFPINFCIIQYKLKNLLQIMIRTIIF